MKWISVEEKLPSYTKQCGGDQFAVVLMADNTGAVWAGDYINGKFCVFGVEHAHITHWMPFPTPPEKDDEK